jgi:hypothetical protein
MSKEEYDKKIDALYNAVRKIYKYTDYSDELVDFVIDLADAGKRDLVEEA